MGGSFGAVCKIDLKKETLLAAVSAKRETSGEIMCLLLKKSHAKNLDMDLMYIARDSFLTTFARSSDTSKSASPSASFSSSLSANKSSLTPPNSTNLLPSRLLYPTAKKVRSGYLDLSSRKVLASNSSLINNETRNVIIASEISQNIPSRKKNSTSAAANSTHDQNKKGKNSFRANFQATVTSKSIALKHSHANVNKS